MLRKFAMLLPLSCILAASLAAQGLTTQASKDDWEEINFEFNSAVLSDGYPSLLRLADLLHKNSGYHVKVEGNTDNIGSERANEKLGLARANAVRDFLVKYGASAGQIDVGTRGKKDPKYPGFKSGYSKTDVARWMNRRVVLTATDQNGKTISDGGVGPAIAAMPSAGANPGCCDDILKRLDAITGLLNDMKNANAGLKRELDDLKNQQASLDNKVNNLPKPLNEQQTAQVVDARLEKARDPRFSLLGLNIGADDQRNLTFTGSGRFFAPFKDHFAVQIQGEYMYFRNQKEGQADIGLVNRYGAFQTGLFASFKNVSINGSGNGTIAQGSAVLDYLFQGGKVGLFGSKGFLNEAVLGTTSATFTDANGNTMIAPNIYNQRYLRLSDQIGVQATIGLWKTSYLESNMGYIKASTGGHVGGTARLVFPFTTRLAFTVEGGVNETMVSAGTANGRAVVGLQFGNYEHPKEYLADDKPLPMQVPRVRYEVLSRTIHKGVSQPIADAGPDQIGVPAGTITLNGSNSRDPNGEQLTFQWIQESQPAVALSAANQPITTFQATAGQAYVFRLTVRNTDGQTAAARVRVTTVAAPTVEIVAFFANPPAINLGQASTLQWRVTGADTVVIDNGIGTVNPTNGTISVSPTNTTTYKLTATNKQGSQNSSATVTVNRPGAQLLSCFAQPASILLGESSTLNWTTLNADTVSIAPGIGNVPKSGSFTVTPTAAINYTITATNAFSTDSCSIAVRVAAGPAPQILKFTALPPTIDQGQTSTLVWAVNNADTITIDQGIGSVDHIAGTRDVQPPATITYTLTAVNKFGTTTMPATVTVRPVIPPVNPPKIVSFTANPPTTSGPGGASVLTCKASDAAQIVISGVGPVDASGNLTVNPQVTTTYVCVATGKNPAQQASANVTVTVPSGPGTPPINTSVCRPVVSFDTPNSGTTVCQTVVRSLDVGYVIGGNTTPTSPIGFNTTSRNTAAVVLNSTGQQVSVQVSELFGDYFFDWTATDAAGRTTSGTVDIQYVISHIPR